MELLGEQETEESPADDDRGRMQTTLIRDGGGGDTNGQLPP
jgi:hypothetical protein